MKEKFAVAKSFRRASHQIKWRRVSSKVKIHARRFFRRKANLAIRQGREICQVSALDGWFF